MKNLLLLTFILFTTTSQADFIDAQKNYYDKNYELAFKEFMILAKYGNIKSQHNIAVMYLKGLGTKQDLIQAYAWSKISDSLAKYKDLTQIISDELSDNDLLKAQIMSEQYNKKYAHANSKIILGPIVNVKNEPIESRINIEIDSTQTVAPNYPRALAINKVQGWVRLLFYVYPDGSIRDIQILEEVPKGAFHKEAISVIEYYKFSFKQGGINVSLDEPYPVTQKIEFRLSGESNGLIGKQKRYLDKLLTKAESGELLSQYEYAAIQDRDLIKTDVEKGKMNLWLFKAAQHGITDAQYRLGKNIYYGKDCKVEKQKGLDWIMQAAEIGNSLAQFMAYKMLKNKSVINQSNQEPIYWLKQAAKNGLSIAQLLYAQEIANQEKTSKVELNIAKKYLKRYGKDTFKTVQWYQITALIEDKSKKHRKALNKINSAIDKATKFGWDLTELKQQKDMIKAHKKG